MAIMNVKNEQIKTETSESLDNYLNEKIIN